MLLTILDISYSSFDLSLERPVSISFTVSFIVALMFLVMLLLILMRTFHSVPAVQTATSLLLAIALTTDSPRDNLRT